jgi:hypothetical protein
MLLKVKSALKTAAARAADPTVHLAVLPGSPLELQRSQPRLWAAAFGHGKGGPGTPRIALVDVEAFDATWGCRGGTSRSPPAPAPAPAAVADHGMQMLRMLSDLNLLGPRRREGDLDLQFLNPPKRSLLAAPAAVPPPQLSLPGPRLQLCVPAAKEETTLPRPQLALMPPRPTEETPSPEPQLAQTPTKVAQAPTKVAGKAWDIHGMLDAMSTKKTLKKKEKDDAKKAKAKDKGEAKKDEAKKETTSEELKGDAKVGKTTTSGQHKGTTVGSAKNCCKSKVKDGKGTFTKGQKTGKDAKDKLGCSKCRFAVKGCARCRQWA